MDDYANRCISIWLNNPIRQNKPLKYISWMTYPTEVMTMDKLLFPFVSIVGQEDMKRALLLNIVDPGIGGALIKG